MFFKPFLSCLSFCSRNIINVRMLRYFPNTLPDYKAGEIEVKDEDLVERVQVICGRIGRHFPANEKNAEDGLYLGTAGVAYMYYHLSKLSAFKGQEKIYIKNAIEYIKPALELAAASESSPKQQPSFLLGSGGVWCVAAALYARAGDAASARAYSEKYARVAAICKRPFLQCGDDELFVGRAGYLCGALWLARETGATLPLRDLYDICNAIVDSGRRYSAHNRSIAPLMYAYYQTEYLGAGHGLCSILQMVMSVPGYLDAHTEAARDVRASVDALLELQTDDGNFPCATDELNLAQPVRDSLVHWCHGAPGVVYLLARAYVLWGDQSYLNACRKAADLVWQRGLLRKGPGICHGVAGNAYVFLLLYRLTQEPQYLHRARAFAQFMHEEEFRTHARTPDNPYSLYEGIAGTACFLADLTQPDQAVFPFNNVF